MNDPKSRRQFLQTAASAAAIGSIGALQGGDAAQAADGPALSNDKPLAVHSEICPQHVDLVLRRSRQEHEHVRASLKKSGARPLTVAACQMANHCGGEKGKQANLERMTRAIDAAADRRVQVLAFPEMCLPGYFTRADGTSAEATRINRALADEVGSSDVLRRLQDAARAAEMVLAFGFCERDGRNYYNAIGVINADGSWLGTRRKNPLSPHPYETEPFTEPDPSRRSAVFKTRYGTVGISNCFDGEFPESIRQMRLDGAELLLWCNAATGNPKLGHSARINSAGCYAQANRIYVVCCNAVGGSCYGTSVIVGPSGEPLVILPPSDEALGVATINLAVTEQWDTWRLRLDPKLGS
jgi:N-carbamoylputrescine amidase